MDEQKGNFENTLLFGDLGTCRGRSVGLPDTKSTGERRMDNGREELFEVPVQFVRGNQYSQRQEPEAGPVLLDRPHERPIHWRIVGSRRMVRSDHVRRIEFEGRDGGARLREWLRESDIVATRRPYAQ